MAAGSLNWGLGTERATIMRLLYLLTGLTSCGVSFQTHEVP